MFSQSDLHLCLPTHCRLEGSGGGGDGGGGRDNGGGNEGVACRHYTRSRGVQTHRRQEGYRQCNMRCAVALKVL